MHLKSIIKPPQIMSLHLKGFVFKTLGIINLTSALANVLERVHVFLMLILLITDEAGFIIRVGYAVFILVPTLNW